MAHNINTAEWEQKKEKPILLANAVWRSDLF